MLPQADSTSSVCGIRVGRSGGSHVLRAVWLPGVVGVLLLLGLPQVAAGQLEYGPRGDRSEGIKPQPIAAYDIELVSARADYTEEAAELPSRLRFKFYLEEPADAYVTVRELDYRHFYWLDNVEPTAPWRAGFDNDFAWSTRDVLGSLNQILMYDLGVVVRLDSPEARSTERIAPAIFYHSEVPATIEGYLFTFRTGGTAFVMCTIYGEPPSDVLFTRTIPRQPEGRPFTIRWDSTRRRDGTTGAPVAPGWYSLVVSGYFLDTNDPFRHSIRFYHQPAVQ